MVNVKCDLRDQGKWPFHSLYLDYIVNSSFGFFEIQAFSFTALVVKIGFIHKNSHHFQQEKPVISRGWSNMVSHGTLWRRLSHGSPPESSSPHSIRIPPRIWDCLHFKRGMQCPGVFTRPLQNPQGRERQEHFDNQWR